MEDHQDIPGQTGDHSPDHHSDQDHGEHAHGHHHEGWWRQLFYLRHAPQLWKSPINDAVVELIGPAEGERVLDVGAGMGPAVLAASRRVGDGRVFAVEPSPLMRAIMQVRRGVRSSSTERIVVLKGKAEQIPVEETSIDAAWSINCVHHWVDDRAACAELGRALRPDARLLLLDEQFADPTHPRHDSFDHDRRDKPGFFHEIDTDRLSCLLVEEGFRIEQAGEERLDGVPVKMVRAVRLPDADRPS